MDPDPGSRLSTPGKLLLRLVKTKAKWLTPGKSLFRLASGKLLFRLPTSGKLLSRLMTVKIIFRLLQWPVVATTFGNPWPKPA